MKKHKTFVEQMDKIYCKPEDFKIEYPLDVLLLTDNNIQVIKVIVMHIHNIIGLTQKNL